MKRGPVDCPAAQSMGCFCSGACYGLKPVSWLDWPPNFHAKRGDHTWPGPFACAHADEPGPYCRKCGGKL